MVLVLRGKINAAGTVDLIDPVPADFDRSQEVEVILEKKPSTYETVNDYGDLVLVDEENGTVSPYEIMTVGELVSDLGGIWADRRAEIGDSVQWVKAQRQQEEERRDPWRGRTLS